MSIDVHTHLNDNGWLRPGQRGKTHQLVNRRLILGALLPLVAMMLSVENADVGEVKFHAWRCSTSLALLMFATLASELAGGWAEWGALRLKSKVQKPWPNPPLCFTAVGSALTA